MSLTVNSRVIAEARLENLRLQECAGAFELIAHLSLQSTPIQGERRWITIFSGRAALRNSGSLVVNLGDARPMAPIRVFQNQYSLTRNAQLRLTLQPHQIAKIEALRSGGDLDLELRIYGEGGISEGNGEPTPVEETLRTRLERSGWIEQLRRANALDILLLEVPMPPADAPSPAVVRLVDAQRHFVNGDYRECIGLCRLAVDELGSLGPDRLSAALTKLSKERPAMTKEERVDVLAAAVRNAAHQAHHSDADGGCSTYSRADAALILAATAALIAHRVHD